MSFRGRIALITGSSRGIGRATALHFADLGADVIVNYQTSADAAREVAGLIESKGRRTMVCQADVSNKDDVEKMRDEVLKRFGRVDILVNNAGITRDKSFAKMDYDMWRAVISAHVDGAYLCTKAFIDGMADRGYGRIVNVSSIIGQMGNFGQANYSAAKAALIGLTKTLAREYARKKVTVNAVAPGFIETDMLRGVPEEVKQKLLTQIPLGRFGTAEEVAKAIAYLCSDDAAWITGQVLAINGGQYM